MFITIDGPDGVGKTSVAKELVKSINYIGGSAIYTSEPTQDELGIKIRNILRYGNVSELQKLTEYFIEDRRNHVKFITEQINANQIVICDRYIYSTVVYQHLQGEKISDLITMNSEFLKPDYSFILNVDSVDTLLSHIVTRGEAADLFESRSVLKNAISLYERMNVFFPNDNIIFVNANQPINKTVSLIKEYICP